MKKLSALSVIVRFSDAIGINPNHVSEIIREDGSGFKWIVKTGHDAQAKYYVEFNRQTGEVSNYKLI